MKRDMDLVRTILKEVAASHEPRGPRVVDVRGYTSDQIAYHMKLMIQAELIEAVDVGTSDPAYIHPNLTWRGQDFLDSAQNERIWQKLKAELKDRGLTIPFSLIQTLLTKLVSQELGLKNGD